VVFIVSLYEQKK
ncbi:unnamed protein product, partial [Oikopleura dioica]